ncbi:hypothetical protein EIP91_009400 [Steccherinum ochraceum]|uniref:Zinc finger Mcm10/DnaG-type domain-containing protein n=1 Tax=Steccherinum ochraceum TaxID=92696 RepID=A0A4R0R1P3_9APHY|nr:hypothetical protein EIP91_009400 [Steccherinum ochraceum]
MDSETIRKQQEQTKKVEIERQIAALQAQLNSLPKEDRVENPRRDAAKDRVLARSPKRRKVEHKTLAPGTPSPKRPPPAAAELGDDYKTLGVPQRDDRLALVEDLEIGPSEHTAPFDDPHFEHLEPNSGIRLSSRTLPHDDLQDYLRGRYYLSPSKLYSVIRLLPNKQGYDVPVEGDWVTIAVVAERGPLKYSKAPVGVGRGDQEHLPQKDAKVDEIVPDVDSKTTDLRHWKGKAKQEQSRPSGKKYINLKLIDFGCRSGSSSATGGKSTIRGDAFLSLLLFESDRVEDEVREDGTKRKVYRGGSKGAFERISKLKEGAVVALLNPRILKPFQRSGDTPHPTDNILAVTPESIDSTVVIGHSKDLGMCKAVKRDGKPCGSWCDKRVSEICEWHIQHTVQAKRAGRAEFSLGTGGMSMTAKKKAAYDPSKQWGLKPEPGRSQGDGATYVVSGHIVSGHLDTKSLFVGENLGREAQAKAARQATGKDNDRVLQSLLKRDKTGMKTLAAARAFVKQPIGSGKKDKKKVEVPSKRSRQSDETSDESDGSEGDDVENSQSGRKSAYSAQLIRNLGFDPTIKDGRKAADPNVQRKLEALAASHSARREVDLGPRPGKKQSSVRPPTAMPPSNATRSCSLSPPLAFDESDDDLVLGALAVPGAKVGSNIDKMVDLDSSDVELE